MVKLLVDHGSDLRTVRTTGRSPASWPPSGRYMYCSCCVCVGVHSWPACLPGCLPACLHAWVPGCLGACLPSCLPACLLACLPACVPACLPACLGVCLPAFMPGCLGACLPACLLPACLRACLCVCLLACVRACMHFALTLLFTQCARPPPLYLTLFYRLIFFLPPGSFQGGQVSC